MDGSRARIRIAENMARTPPSLFGMDRRIVYAQRKYHSGLMWSGVERGLAGIKFSGSENRYGNHSTTLARIIRVVENPRRSFTV